ncbi:MAG: M28 family peptidase [Chitinophagaceae bacterium]
MKKLFTFLFLMLSLVVFAQKKSSPSPYAKSITASDLQKHLYTVASKEMQGRETATPGQKKAAAYIEDYFKSLGLQPGNKGSYQMSFPVYQDEVLKSILEINNAAYKLNDEYQPYSFTNYNTSQYFSEVVFAGHGIADSTFNDYSDVNAAGKLVMIMDGAPSAYQSKGSPGIFTKIMNAQKKGAAGILIVSNNFPRTARATGSMYRELYRSSQYLPTWYISEKLAAVLMGETDWANVKEDYKKEKLPAKVYAANIHLEFEKKVNKMESSNVLGLLEGTDLKDEYVFLTAHYDHIGMRNDTTIFYGADDDGSGTVSILELAEAFTKAKAEGKGPRRSIVFMTVSGEEKGLWGSEYYANNPTYPLDKTTVDLNIDMIGRIGEEYLKHKDSANYVYVIGDDKLSSDLVTITNQVNKNLKLKLDRKYNDLNDKNRFYYRSDHYNFAEKGVPIIFYFNGVHADYHRATDTPDKINYKLLTKRAQLVFYTAWEMANRNDMLKRDLKLDPPKAF